MFENVNFENAQIFADNKRIVRLITTADDFTLIEDFSLETGKCVKVEFFEGVHLISGLNAYDQPTKEYSEISRLFDEHFRDVLEVLFSVEVIHEMPNK